MSTASHNWGNYQAAFRSDAHRLLAWGYQDARALLGPDTEETEITGHICEAVARRLDDPDMDLRFDRYFVGEDQPIPGEDRTGKKRRRTDIRIQWSALRPRPKYVFEAKRLRHDSHGIGRYVGVEGLRRFIDDTSYARDATEAAMLGFVQTPTAEEWAKKLEQRLDQDEHDQLRVRAPLAPVETGGLFELSFMSGHQRFDNHILEVHHLLLDCT